MASASVPNQFLRAAFEDRVALHTNLCATCNLHGIKDLMLTALPRRSEEYRNNRFRATLDLIVALYSFKIKCREVGGCGCGVWLRRNTRLNGKERARVTEKVRHAYAVFRDWETIVFNLTNQALTDVDCRDFTVKKFYQARSFSWCLKQQNENSGVTGTSNDPTEEYDQQKFSNIVEHICRTKILDDVSFDEDQASLISKNLGTALLEMCKAARR